MAAYRLVKIPAEVWDELEAMAEAGDADPNVLAALAVHAMTISYKAAKTARAMGVADPHLEAAAELLRHFGGVPSP